MIILSIKKIFLNFIVILSVSFSMLTINSCKEETGTEGLVYSLNEDDTYSVVGFNKPPQSFRFSSITIPAKYNKKPVTIIDDYCFQYMEIIEINLPEGLLKIGKNAFQGTQIKNVTIPNSVTSIGDCCFSNSKLISATLGDGLEEVQGFESCSYLETVTFGKNVKKIASSAFLKCYKLNNIELPDGLVSIGNTAFDSCSYLDNITIPSSLSSIGTLAFSDCNMLHNVFYRGTAEQWNDLISNHTMGGNDRLINAYVVYNYTE